MDKYFKITFILNLTSIVIIVATGVLFSIGTFSVTEETQKVLFAIILEFIWFLLFFI